MAATPRGARRAEPGLTRSPGLSAGGADTQAAARVAPPGARPANDFRLALAEREVNDARLYAERSVRGAPDLAEALVRLAVELDDRGRTADAMGVYQETVAVYRVLAAARPAAHRQLAVALVTLSDCQRRHGLHTDALASAQDAVAIARRLVESGRPTDAGRETGRDQANRERILAGSLSNLGVQLGAVGRLEEAIVARRDAVEMLRRLTPQRQRPAATGGRVTDPTKRYQDLSQALTNLGSGLIRIGRHEEARDACEEAVELGRWAVSAHPVDGEPVLAMALNNLSAAQSKLGHNTDAVAVATEAVSLRRRLAARHPARFGAALAAALNNLGWALTSAGHHQEALAPTGEAVRIYRSITVISTTEVADHYVSTLGSYAKARAYAGVETDEAVAALEEAVATAQTMATTLPLAFTTRLSETYERAADAFDRLGHTERAAHFRQLRDNSGPPA